jgi:hypothetical protein
MTSDISLWLGPSVGEFFPQDLNLILLQGHDIVHTEQDPGQNGTHPEGPDVAFIT